MGIDGQDQNLDQNLKGGVEAVFTPDRDQVEATPLAPYSEVFGLQRFREVCSCCWVLQAMRDEIQPPTWPLG